MEQRKIFVLLTQFPGRGAQALRWWSGCPYTHVSIGLDEDMNTFYSFVFKGFIVEDIARYNKPGRKLFRCELYSMDVSQETYQEVRDYISTFVRKRARLHYSRVGLALSLMGIPWKIQDGYICSYFVADILKKCAGAKLSKHSCLCMPKDFSRSKQLKMVFRGDLLRYMHHFGISPHPV